MIDFTVNQELLLFTKQTISNDKLIINILDSEENLLLVATIVKIEDKFNLGLKFNTDLESSFYTHLTRESIETIFQNFLDSLYEIQEKKFNEQKRLTFYKQLHSFLITKDFYLTELFQTVNQFKSKNEYLNVYTSDTSFVDFELKKNSTFSGTMISSKIRIPIEKLLKHEAMYDVTLSRLKINLLLQEIEEFEKEYSELKDKND